jgi:hypothetical protein
MRIVGHVTNLSQMPSLQYPYDSENFELRAKDFENQFTSMTRIEPDMNGFHGRTAAAAVPYGQGIEAENSAALRSTDPSYADYNRKTHPAAIQLTKLIGPRFTVKTLASMSEDVFASGEPKIGRDDRRAEWSLVRYIMRHFEKVSQMWRAHEFAVQKGTEQAEDEFVIDDSIDNRDDLYGFFTEMCL